MHKKLSIFLKVLTGMLFILACQKETSLIKNENVLAGLHDSIPNDTIPHDTIPHDTIPHDTIPHDTIPHDTIPQPPRDTITGLVIKLDVANDDSTILFYIETKNAFPDAAPQLFCYPTIGYSSLTLNAYEVWRSSPSTTFNTAKAFVYYKPNVNGDYPFTVNVQGNTYSGSITVTNTQYTFNWNHDTHVTISPKILTR